MAWVGDRWLNRDERTERIELLTRRLRKFRELINAGKATEYHIETMRKDMDELKRLKRVHRAEFDVAYFAYEYFSDAWNPDNDDNIIANDDDGRPHDSFENIAPIHREFFDLCDYVDHVNRSARLAIAAPRGHSKSGVFSNIFPIHQIVYRKRKYILIISETDSLSKKLVDWINKQLKFNQKLREDFGPLLHEKNTMNEKDNEEAFITMTGALVEASSSGKQLRGKRHGSKRPDLVIVDDPSSENNENTKEARQKLIHWFNSVVIPIGSRNTAIILVGTMVSSTGLLNHVLKRPDFRASYHDAIVSEPKYPELWQEYCEIYARCKEDDKSEADAFYEQHKDKMEEGVQVAWPWRWSYRELMHEKVNMGTRAFNSEYRSRAYSEDEQFFKPENFGYYRYKTVGSRRYILYDGHEIPVDELTISGAWDIAMGKTSRSAFNSVITVGRHEQSGLLFVLDEYATKQPPHVVLKRIVELIRQWRHHTFAVETINAYHEFYRQLAEQLRLEGLYYTRLIPVASHKTTKEQRIESLEPLCENKTLIFNENHKILLEQMAQYPHGDYVDSIDALQLAVEHLARPKARLVTKPSWL